MSNTFYSETPTGPARHASRPFSLLETMLIESKGEDGNVQTERVIWTWKVHEVALHEASQREGLLMIGSQERLLKKVSEEVTRKAQEKLHATQPRYILTKVGVGYSLAALPVGSSDVHSM